MDPVTAFQKRTLFARVKHRAAEVGRTHWEVAWSEPDGAQRGQVWHGTLDEFSEMAVRNGFTEVEVHTNAGARA